MTLRLAVVLLLCGAWVAAADNDTRYNPSMCEASFPCGANVNIHYPFFLANATMAIDGYDTALSYCGYPGMAVSCDEDAGRATLQLHGDNYTVLDINYADHTATVADADVLVDGGGDCPRITHNVTVPAGTWLNLSTAANDNLVFFFDCDFAAAAAGPNEPPPGLPPPINCTGFPGRGGGVGMPSYVAEEPDVPAAWDELLSSACKAVVTVPVLKYWLLSGDNLPRLNDDGYGKVLKRGFSSHGIPAPGPATSARIPAASAATTSTATFWVACAPTAAFATRAAVSLSVLPLKAYLVTVLLYLLNYFSVQIVENRMALTIRKLDCPAGCHKLARTY
jgi:hypothetical protein